MPRLLDTAESTAVIAAPAPAVTESSVFQPLLRTLARIQRRESRGRFPMHGRLWVVSELAGEGDLSWRARFAGS